MKPTIIIILTILLATSCSYTKRMQRAERKIHRLVERFPPLKRIDTIRITDTLPGKEVQLPPIIIDTSTARMDSILLVLDSILADCDSALPHFTPHIRTIYASKPCLTKPYVFDDSLFTFTLTEVDGRLIPHMLLKPRYYEVAVPCPTITIQPCPDCWLRPLIWWEKLLAGLFALALIVALVFINRILR